MTRNPWGHPFKGLMSIPKAPHYVKGKKIDLSEEALLEKISQRQEARNNKDWATSDEIRDELAAKGIILEDKQDGTAWKIKLS